jgi:hypothetical protein
VVSEIVAEKEKKKRNFLPTGKCLRVGYKFAFPDKISKVNQNLPLEEESKNSQTI